MASSPSRPTRLELPDPSRYSVRSASGARRFPLMLSAEEQGAVATLVHWEDLESARYSRRRQCVLRHHRFVASNVQAAVAQALEHAEQMFGERFLLVT